MKSKVPRRVPWILPLVRHRDDVGIVEMFPLMIATARTFGRGFGRRWITVKPVLDHIVVILFGPEHAAECLTHNQSSIIRKMFWNYGLIKVVSFVNSRIEDLFEVGESLRFLVVRLIRQT